MEWIHDVVADIPFPSRGSSLDPQLLRLQNGKATCTTCVRPIQNRTGIQNEDGQISDGTDIRRAWLWLA